MPGASFGFCSFCGNSGSRGEANFDQWFITPNGRFACKRFAYNALSQYAVRDAAPVAATAIASAAHAAWRGGSAASDSRQRYVVCIAIGRTLTRRGNTLSAFRSAALQYPTSLLRFSGCDRCRRETGRVGRRAGVDSAQVDNASSIGRFHGPRAAGMVKLADARTMALAWHPAGPSGHTLQRAAT